MGKADRLGLEVGPIQKSELKDWNFVEPVWYLPNSKEWAVLYNPDRGNKILESH